MPPGPQLVDWDTPVSPAPINLGLRAWYYSPFGGPGQSSAVWRDLAEPAGLTGTAALTGAYSWATTPRGDWALNCSTTATGVGTITGNPLAGSGAGTIAAWVMFTSVSFSPVVIFNNVDGGTGDGWNLSLDGAAAPLVQFRKLVGYSGSYIASNAGVAANTWYRVLGTVDAAGNGSLYVNGVKQTATATYSTAAPAPTTNTVIAQASSSRDIIAADVRVLTRGFTAADAWEDYVESQRGWPTGLNRFTPAAWLFLGKASGGDVSAALTGLSATTSAGTLTPVVAVALSGAAATGSTGTLTPATSYALTGSASTTSAGTLVPTLALPLSGSAATGSAGTLTPAVSYALSGAESATAVGVLAGGLALSGQAATVSAGTLTPAPSYALTGAAATSSAGTLTPGVSVALSGSSSTTSAGTLTPTVAVALTGAAATSAVGTLTPAVTVPLSGIAVAVSAGTLTAVQDGQVALTGLAVTASAGSVGVSVVVPLTGASVTASAGTLTATSGTSEALTGEAVTTAAGTVTPTVVVALSGLAVTVSAGSLSAVGGDSDVGVATTGTLTFTQLSSGTLTYAGLTTGTLELE